MTDVETPASVSPGSPALLTWAEAAEMTIDSVPALPWSAPTHAEPPVLGDEGGIPLAASRLASPAGYEYDDQGRVTSITDENAAVTRFTYDDSGNLETLTDPDGNVTTWTYDAQGRIIQETDTLGAGRTFEYNDAGDLVRYIDGYVGNCPTYATDATGLSQWDNDTILLYLKEVHPGLASLWGKYGKLEGGAQERAWYNFFADDAPSLTVTYDDNVHGTLSNRNRVTKITAKVPDNWTSMQVAVFIAQEAASDSKLLATIRNTFSLPSDADLHLAVGQLAEWQAACEEIAEALETGTKIAVSFVPGAIGVLLISDLAEGHFGEALLDAVPCIPAGKIGTAALTFVFKGGGTAKKVTVAAPVVKFISGMSNAEKAALKAELAGKSAAEAEGILARLVPDLSGALSHFKIGTFSVLGSKQLVGKSFRVKILMFGKFAGEEAKLVSLFDALEKEAAAAGGNEIRIVGEGVRKAFTSAKLAEKYGYELRILGENTVEWVKKLL